MEPPGHMAQNYLMIGIVLAAAAFAFLFLIQRYRLSKRQLRTEKEYQMALKLLDQLIRQDPTNAMAFWQKGQVYEAMGKHDRAIRFYHVAHQMCPRAYAYQSYWEAYDRLKGNLKLKPPLVLHPLN